ncbi:DUF4344 domain-containing metallopeptidase [Fluviibacterium sp. DFM31]|uniref:DUF4344 domain-containing metallopeptidase n=1 Tax=Meridianimarinicoccus marinus TaxID=3231483 RepID=A0ABV3L262_9RHOB
MRAALAAAALASAAVGPMPAPADSDDSAVAAFVEANLISIFYHEIGHALIDQLALPIFGQEEDAADVFSILMIDALFEEDSAQAIAYDAALGFLAEAELRDATGDEIAWWDVHGVDEQRFYTTTCLFYGANPEVRDDLARDLALPEERADYCVEEFDLAAESWGIALEEIADGPGQLLLYVEDGSEGWMAEVIGAEVEEFNALFGLKRDIDVWVMVCEEANAFYDPDTTELIFCVEFIPHLEALAGHL